MFVWENTISYLFLAIVVEVDNIFRNLVGLLLCEPEISIGVRFENPEFL